MSVDRCRPMRGALTALGALLMAAPAMAGTLSVVYSFTGGADGAQPYKGVTLDSSGNIYGETFYGAVACPDSYQYADVGCGTVYRIKPTGAEKNLASFRGAPNGADGFSNLTLGTKILYGGTYLGGGKNQGLIFSVAPSGENYTVLHSFRGTDGALPNSFLRIATTGAMFSVTAAGGPGYNGTAGSGSGVLFELTPDGTFVSEHPFSGGTDGGGPGRIFLDAANNVYGATATGGSCTGSGLPASGCGVIYSFVPDTGVFTVLYTFAGGNDGYQPALGGLDKLGNLYGTTVDGGANGDGTIFELAKKGTGYRYKTLYAFTGKDDGFTPYAAPTYNNGTLVGTTIYGGTGGAGVLYSLANGVFTTLYSFANDSNGGYPESTPTVAKDGSIYGTTAFGGVSPCDTSGGTLISSYGCGVVFKYSP